MIPYAGKSREEKYSPHGDNKEPRTERIDLRLTVAEKDKLTAYARARRRSLTSILTELIENLGKEKGPE